MRPCFVPNRSVSLPVALGLLLLLAGPALAQSPTLTSNRTTFSGDCRGGDAFVKGNNNEVTLKGYCRDLTVSGNNNRVLVEMTSSGRILVPGMGNQIQYRIPEGGLPPQMTVTGTGSEVKLVAGYSETPRSGVVEPREVGRVRQ